MAQDREYEEEGPLRGQGQAGSDSEHWDAIGSLKRNAKRPDDELTPLLGNSGGSSENSENGPTIPEWEGNADYEGLTWWYRPSVSLAHCVDRVQVQVLTSRSCTGYYPPSSSSPSHSEASSSQNSTLSSPSYVANTLSKRAVKIQASSSLPSSWVRITHNVGKSPRYNRWYPNSHYT